MLNNENEKKKLTEKRNKKLELVELTRNPRSES